MPTDFKMKERNTKHDFLNIPIKKMHVAIPPLFFKKEFHHVILSKVCCSDPELSCFIIPDHTDNSKRMIPK